MIPFRGRMEESVVGKPERSKLQGALSAFFDLAVVVQHHGLGEELVRCFLAEYLGREPSSGELSRLHRQCHFYQLLLNLWNLL